jgi:hypothetical protein
MAEDKDPFAEFGGSIIANDKDPFAEFGGSKLRGKPLQPVLPTGTQPSKRGFEPFLPQVPTKAPSVLTPKGQVDYQEQVKDFKPVVQKQPPLPKAEKPLSNLESIKNTVYNVANSLKGVLPRLSLTSVDVFEKVIGKDLTGRLASLPRIEFSNDGIDIVTGRTPEQIRNESIQSLDYLNTQVAPTAGIVENVRNFNIPGLAAGVIDAAGGLVSTIIPSALSGGSLLVTEMVGGGLYDYNTAKAKSKGVSTEDLYKSGDADFGVPAAIGGVAYSMERIGLKGFTNAISKKLAGSGFKKALLLGTEWNKEGLTEWVQVGLDEANLALANGLSVEDAAIAAADKMSSVEGLEAYAKGFAGSAAASGTARVVKRLVSPKNKTKASELEQQKNQSLQDLANENIPIEAKNAILDVLENTNEQIDDLVNIDRKEVEQLNESQAGRVGEINEKIENIDLAINDANISESTKTILEKQKQELDSELDAIIAAPEIKLAKPTFDTEESLTEEIRAAEKEFNETGDSAEYELKINDLNTRLENLVPAPEQQVETPTEETSTTDLFKIDGQDKFYHASPKKREGRLKEGTAPQFGKGVYFSTNRDLVIDEFGNEVTEVQIKSKKPLFTDSKQESEVKDLAAKKWNEENLTYDTENEMYVDKDGNEVVPVEASDLGERLPVSYYSSAAKELGYDVIVDKGSSSYDNEIVVIDESIIIYPQEDAVQVETTGQVPVQPEAPVSEEVEQGKPEAKPKVVTEEGVKAEEVVSGAREDLKKPAIEVKNNAKDSVKGTKVSDENEEPIVVYHGTQRKFDTFELPSYFGNARYSTQGGAEMGMRGKGIFFSSNKDAAKSYSVLDKRKKSYVMEAYLDIKNPYIIDAKGKAWTGIIADEYKEGLQNKNYDGVIVKNVIDAANNEKLLGNVYAVKDPSQIKIIKEQTPAQKVEQLRAKEQVELKAAIPNADQYLTDGKVDRTKITDAKELKKFDKIYDKYDKLITPLLPKKEAPAPKQEAPAKAEPKLKPRVETRIKFAKAIELFNDISATKGGAKKRTLSAKRKLFLEQNPSIKYIDDNWRKISKQLEDKGLLKKEGNCP